MPKGPNGQTRPADAIGLAVMIGKISTGEIEDSPKDSDDQKAKPTNTVIPTSQTHHRSD